MAALAGPWGPAVLGGLGMLGGLLLALLVAALRRRRDPADELEALARGQERLAGALGQVAEAQAAAQVRLATALDARLSHVEGRMGETLAESAARTAHSLGRLGVRLEAVDRAQARMEALSGDILGLRQILDNKQARGAFGEIQLMEIVGRALPPDAWEAQATLSNGRRADCLVRLGHPPGPIAVDAKFPLEAWQALAAAPDKRAEKAARSAFRTALMKHIRDIAERYIIEGETADSALMFLPSEAVYAEAHAHFADVVRAGLEARVWIVSPTTLMAVLNTMRGVMKDARLRAEGARIRRELGLLARDVGRLGERAQALERHLRLAGAELDGVRLSAERAGRRAARLEAVDFSDDAPQAAE
ncbi:DNA recombination protein RmuC [Paralimibaculum aggregatum]|uniref:DNA recombination protein RmuC homolog n=2 Tax=Paralimibaculum aggregatum TaxID=3036245 RepID=A0ABQ6LL13_9RHOB|nr:DNA recombination protein RmuC [Limibaculum sp. NKW23]